MPHGESFSIEGFTNRECISGVIRYIVPIIVCIWGVKKIYKKIYKMLKDDENDDCSEDVAIPVVITLLFFIGGLFIALYFTLFHGIARLINPDFYVINYLINLVK